MKQPFAVRAGAEVPVSVAQARQWFLDLGAHPERYVFETHAGFAFTQGDFGQPGARFVTRERFRGLRAALHFELTEVGEQHFYFRLLRPPLPVRGAYVIEAVGANAIDLVLRVEGTTPLGNWLLRCPVIRKAIGRQIRSEVEHVKASMEALSAPDRV